MNFIIDKHGHQIWRNEKNIANRLNGPAVICTDGKHYWFRHGKKHRLDGPARYYDDSGDYKGWYWLGKLYTEKGHTLLSNIKFFTRRVKI